MSKGILSKPIIPRMKKAAKKFGTIPINERVIFLNKIISPFIMSIIFFLVVTPIGLIMRLLGKDLLNLKYNKGKTYWIEKKGPKSKMKNQF